MKWVGDPQRDLILSLMDETGAVVLGQVVVDGKLQGWHGYDCSLAGNRKKLGRFGSPDAAKDAVASVVYGRKLKA